MQTWTVYPTIEGDNGRDFRAERLEVTANGALLFYVKAPDGDLVIKYVIPPNAYACCVQAN